MRRSRYRRPAVGGSRPTRRVSPHARFSRRLTALTALFVGVCVIYAILLIALQARGNAYAIYVEDPSVPTGGSAQTVTVQAVRGEIYDRNGKPLVTNVYSYDLELDYNAFRAGGSVQARNRALLTMIRAVSEAPSGALADAYFPFEGEDTALTWSAEAQDAGSAVATRLSRVLERLGLGTDTSAAALVTYYIDTYELDAQTDGIPLYTKEEQHALLRVYYDMDATAFQPAVPYTLATGVPATLISSQKEANVAGVLVTVRAERVYHYPGYASHILGRVGQIFAEDWAYYNALGYPMNALVGVSGCESAFETILHGTDGEMLITRDENGRTVSTKMVTQPIAGQDIRLTIDIDVQIAAEDALRERIENSPTASAGAVVAMHTETGEYLAVASAPTYDISLFTQNYNDLSVDPSLPLVNRALSATYAPGALMHLPTALAGLSDGAVSSATVWEDAGRLSLDGTIVASCPKLLTGGHGTLGISTALRDGCSVFFGKLATRIDSHTFTNLERALGIGVSTGVELGDRVGSNAGALLAPPLTMIRAAQGLSGAACTPAQLCAMLSTVLEGGNRYAGQLLLDVRDFTTGEVIYRKSPELLSSTPLDGGDRQLVLRAMKNAALLDSDALELTRRIRDLGVEVGLLGATAPNTAAGSDNALVLMYGEPAQGAAVKTDGSAVSIAVVLEQGSDPAQAYPIGAAVLDAWFYR